MDAMEEDDMGTENEKDKSDDDGNTDVNME